METPAIKFNDVYGQERIKKFLLKAYTQNRLSHGYLFVGEEGVGKVAMALAFSKALLCTGPPPRPCGVCKSCKMFAARSHPNLKIIFPHPRSAKDQDIQAVLQSIYHQPYLVKKLWSAPNISIEEVRTLRRELSLASQGGENRIAIFLDAHEMTAEATNALLKTLEEPPKNSYFILITSSPDQLLPTVLSRCQQVRFNLLTATEIETALEQWTDLEEKERILIAGLAQGSLRRALELTGEDLKSLKQHAVDLLRTAFKNPSQRAAYAQELARQVDRRYLKEVLENLILWLRDAFHISLLGEERAQKYLANVDDLVTLSRFVNNFPRFNYDQAIQEIDRSVNMLDRYVQPLLVLSVLLKNLGQCGRGQVQEKAA